MDQHGVWQRVKGFSVPDWLLRLTSFVANTLIAAASIFAACLGLLTTQLKLTVDEFDTGLMARYETFTHEMMAYSGSVAQFQRDWNFRSLVVFTVVREGFPALLVALASHELWLRRINDRTLVQGRPALKKAYRPGFLRCHTRWGSVWQAVRTAALVLSVLVATFVAVFGAWMVEDNNSRAGLSFPLAALNRTLYYGDIVPETSVDPKTANFSSPELLVDTVSLLREKGLIHAANPPLSYHALYPGDMLDIPEEMRSTGYYLPRSSFPSLQTHLARSSREQMRITEAPSPASANLTTNGILFGNAIYPHVNTLGIGINMSTYEEFWGDGMPGLPRDYIFGGMLGKVYGNAVNVQCVDVTDEYDLSSRESVPEGQVSSMNYTFTKKWSRFPNEVEMHDFNVSAASVSGPLIFSHLSLSGKESLPLSFGLHHEYGTLRAGERIQPFVFNNAPIQTLFILPDGKRVASTDAKQRRINPIILTCIYLPSEFGIEFGVLSQEIKEGVPKADTISTAGPLMLKLNADGKAIGPDGKPMEPPPPPRCVNPMYAIPAARAVHELLTNCNPSDQDYDNHNTTAGGVLREVLAEYYARHPPSPGFGRWESRNARFLREDVIQPVLSTTASGYFSLLRQRVEIANIWVPLDATPQKGTSLRKSRKRKAKIHEYRLGAPSELIGLDVVEDALVKHVVFWILRIGGAAPYGLHWVGILLLLWIGIRSMRAAWRTLWFGRGERIWGRWWEERVANVKGEGNGDEELGKSHGTSGRMLGGYSDEVEKERTISGNEV
ncbi:hypothetical protein QBC37DRAFT_432314 [Rhypophila decipiens]|uniref:Uncharacterized protein n=1 Tax=Rhypophila decipiens TaxID=261697 RepID=A0AAN6XX43_9PEZI|nr:hypothetical protein QBC37DRAFT_432314 [Rhypophila decipiens]